MTHADVIFAHIAETNPFPFVKRWRIYSVDQYSGKKQYIATFRYLRDAENYVESSLFNTLKRSGKELEEMREQLNKDLNK